MTMAEPTDKTNARGAWRRFLEAAPVRAVLASSVLSNLAMAALWVLLWQLGRLVEYTEHASVWFPVAGLSFAVLLIEGARLAPALFAGCVLVTVLVGRLYGLPLTVAQLAAAGVLWALAHIGSYALGAWCLRRIAARGKRELPQLVVGFLLIAAGSSLLATASGMAALVVTNMMPMADVGNAWLPYWIGDMAGVIVLAPFFAAVLGSLRPASATFLSASIDLNQLRATPRFKYKMLLNLVLLTASMWLAHMTRSPNSAFAIFFLVIPSMWMASTESAFCNVFNVALGSFVIALLVHAFGLKEFSMVYQFAINVIAANTLFALAVPTLLADNISLRRLADTDALTQAASRVSLEQRARHEIPRCRAHGEALSVIVFDIDNFKRINDVFGHALGDKALRHACAIAQHALRPTDMLGRFGGDEFVALLPGNDHAAAFAIAERIRVHLQDSALDDGQLLTASFGIAEMRADDSYETLFERADRALYQAKQDGRNRVARLSGAS
jgi:diguanylate cyclase